MDNEIKEMFQMILCRLDKVDSRLDKVDSRLDKVDRRLDNLEGQQAEIKRELIKLNRQIADTYHLALDAWGQSAESMAWLEGKGEKAII